MIVVGVTGGIGSGKSAFCKVWEEEGLNVIYLDDLAKDLMSSDISLKNAIRDVFGSEAYSDDGSLNREYLAEEAFRKNRVKELNALVHPVLWTYLDKMISERSVAGDDLFVIEAAILLNNGRPDKVDKVVLVDSSIELRIKRVMKRDSLDDPSEVKERMSKQPDFKSLHGYCDFVVHNDGTLAELREKAVEVLEQVRSDN